MARALLHAAWASILMVPLGAAGNAILEGKTVAGGKTTSGSQASFGSSFSNIVDGDLSNGVNGEWLPASTTNQYVTVDLGKTYRLQNLNLLNSINQNDRATNTFNVEVSTTGAFSGEQVTLVATTTLQAKSLGFQDFALPTYGDTGNNAVLQARFVRFNALTTALGGLGLTELAVEGIPNHSVAALPSTTPWSTTQVNAKVLTQTTSLSDTAPTSYTLRELTGLSGQIQLTSPSTSVTLQGPTLAAPYNDSTKLVNGLNDSQEVLWAGPPINDLSYGSAILDLGGERIVEKIDLLNSFNFNDRGIKDFILRVGNDATFADATAYEVHIGQFSALNELKSITLSTPVLGRYVQVVTSNRLGFGPGLDEVTVYGQTYASSTLLANGTSQIGTSAANGTMLLNVSTFVGPNPTHMLALDVTTSDGWSKSIVQQVTLVPEPASLALAGLTLGLLRRTGRATRMK